VNSTWIKYRCRFCKSRGEILCAPHQIVAFGKVFQGTYCAECKHAALERQVWLRHPSDDSKLLNPRTHHDTPLRKAAKAAR
jgi:hypothetical protein